MVRILRWGTFTVLLLVIAGVVVGYPVLRQRLVAPMLTAPAGALADTGSSTPPAAPPTSTLSPTARPTLPPTRRYNAAPVQIIEPTASATAIHTNNSVTPTSPSIENPTPPVIATTSLLPADVVAAQITPVVLAPSSGGGDVSAPTPAVLITATLNATIPTTTVTTTDQTAPTVTPIMVTPIAVTPVVVMTVQLTPSTAAPVASTPIVVTTIEVALIPATPTPIGPVANTDSPLYSGPDLAYAIVGEVKVGNALTIIGRYTEGTWYLLANGLWLPGTVVDNAPLALPLVFPTLTPVPTPTPTITPTPPPTATLEGSPTVTATPTSLDAPVCDCSTDSYDCLGNIFANRGEAQRCFEYCFRQKGVDIHLLDPNLNGLACENLP